MSAFAPEPGQLIYDAATRKIGEAVDHIGPYWQLKPVGGGREWDAHGPLRPTTLKERSSSAVALANARSWGELPRARS
ncbi:hypothetical protein ACFYRN_45095 [Streptomyces sp. NPDC005227]|uniref:hypothetical protein n=1 Tax=Streptomyces sp. NPDC005227 TaxID=3364707 RepID=UPI00368A0EE8